MKGRITIRPFKFLWNIAIISLSIYHFGWPVLIPLILIDVDFEDRSSNRH